MNRIILKECKYHGLTEHVIRKDNSIRCKKCAVDAVQKRRVKLKEKAVAYKGGKCICCGYNKHYGSLEFHHVRDKEFGISSKGYTRSWTKVKEELDKCILVCSNCHAEIHNGLINIDPKMADFHIEEEIIDKKTKQCIKRNKK